VSQYLGDPCTYRLDCVLKLNALECLALLQLTQCLDELECIAAQTSKKGKGFVGHDGRFPVPFCVCVLYDLGRPQQRNN